MRIVGDLGSRGASRADSPDGLVRDDQRVRCCGVDAAERDGGLALEDLGGLVGFTLGELLADANDGDEAVSERGLELEVDALVGLVEVLAALTVADQDVGDADRLEHQR